MLIVKKCLAKAKCTNVMHSNDINALFKRYKCMTYTLTFECQLIVSYFNGWPFFKVNICHMYLFILYRCFNLPPTLIPFKICFTIQIYRLNGPRYVQQSIQIGYDLLIGLNAWLTCNKFTVHRRLSFFFNIILF